MIDGRTSLVQVLCVARNGARPNFGVKFGPKTETDERNSPQMTEIGPKDFCPLNHVLHYISTVAIPSAVADRETRNFRADFPPSEVWRILQKSPMPDFILFYLFTVSMQYLEIQIRMSQPLSTQYRYFCTYKYFLSDWYR